MKKNEKANFSPKHPIHNLLDSENYGHKYQWKLMATFCRVYIYIVKWKVIIKLKFMIQQNYGNLEWQ